MLPESGLIVTSASRETADMGTSLPSQSPAPPAPKMAGGTKRVSFFPAARVNRSRVFGGAQAKPPSTVDAGTAGAWDRRAVTRRAASLRPTDKRSHAICAVSWTRPVSSQKPSAP
jgi:hypothetical protein